MLPIFSIFIAVICGMVFWVVCSNSGSKMLVNVVANYFGGRVSIVNGTVVDGLNLKDLHLNVSNSELEIADLHINIKLESLFRGIFKIADLSISSLCVEVLEDRQNTSRYKHMFTSDNKFFFPIEVDNISIENIFFKYSNQSFGDIKLSKLFANFKIDQKKSLFSINNLELKTNRFDSDLTGYLVFENQKSTIFNSEFRFKNKNNSITSTEDYTYGFLNPALFDSSVQVTASGSFDQIIISINAENNEMVANSAIVLRKQSGFVIKKVSIDLYQFKDSGSVSLVANNINNELVNVNLSLSSLDSSLFFIGDIPRIIIGLNSEVKIDFNNNETIDVSVDFIIDDYSKWGDSPMKGYFGIGFKIFNNVNYLNFLDILERYSLINKLKGSITIGSNNVEINSDTKINKNILSIRALMPDIKKIWYKFSGAIDMQINLSGDLSNYRGEIKAYFDRVRFSDFYKWKDLEIQTDFKGARNKAKNIDWDLDISRLDIKLDNVKVTLIDVLTFKLFIKNYLEWHWSVDQFNMIFESIGNGKILFNSKNSRGTQNGWETIGQFKNSVFDSSVFLDLAKILGISLTLPKIERDMPDNSKKMFMYGSWNVQYGQNLSGSISLRIYENDDKEKSDQVFLLDINLEHIKNITNKFDMLLKIQDPNIGIFDGFCSMFFDVDSRGFPILDKEKIFVKLNADITDLSILNYFLKDNIEIGGATKSNIEINGFVDKELIVSGFINGEKLKLIRVDDGIRLLDGSLDADLSNSQLIIKRLFFPANHRVIPQDIRLRDHLTLINKNVTEGYISASGNVDFSSNYSRVEFDVKQFPILQRSDCYAVISGRLFTDLFYKKIYVGGKLLIDTGLVCLDSFRTYSYLDDDVKLDSFVIEPYKENSRNIEVKSDLVLDLGNRFYLTGLGFDTGLLGSLRLSLKNDGRFSCLGTVTASENGVIEVYGQRLSFNRGNLTFQGRIDNPLIDVEAVRLGKQVEPGVKISGTLQHPIIDLISYPNVSDVEKISWLLLGRGPDEQTMDISFLLSVGAAFLSGGQPFYRQFGLSGFDIRSGSIGKSGSILPDHIVAGGINKDNYNDFPTQFVVLSKQFANGINLSLEQSLVASETVARISYRLSRRWSFDMKGGSVNGVAFIYRTFFDD
ncbi:MAG: translocation/assembly module TamB domain-containing protein [Candidatus Kinetoplastibacterium crithidii]|nr:MAG: translocation/assembly module TamB domain-containing protein [Candidatus Kinetoplastibacterium crithidii]